MRNNGGTDLHIDSFSIRVYTGRFQYQDWPVGKNQYSLIGKGWDLDAKNRRTGQIGASAIHAAVDCLIRERSLPEGSLDTGLPLRVRLLVANGKTFRSRKVEYKQW